jgi:AcrR family transcriptional regulator
MCGMGKGEQTRTAVLDEAVRMASTVGFRGLTIGALADRTKMSKSGLFAHFKSKEQLQLDVIDHATTVFVDMVVRPALREPRGEPRVRELFRRSLGWTGAEHWALPGGCPFITGSIELDDVENGPVRRRLVENQRDWLDTVKTVFSTGIAEGHFAADADPDQFAQEQEGIMMGYQHVSRLLADPDAEKRAWNAFERLLASVRPHPDPGESPRRRNGRASRPPAAPSPDDPSPCTRKARDVRRKKHERSH